MERIVDIHVVNTVTIKTVTDLTEVAQLVVRTDFMASDAKKVMKHTLICAYNLGFTKIICCIGLIGTDGLA